jgi:ABC-2 type transport system permease protein
VINALLYLTGAMIRNRLAFQARRLRQPRYAIALALGVGYFWLILLRPSVQQGRAPTSLWTNFETVAALGILLLMLGGWVFSGERMALAFTGAEVQFLFPAPLTRRGLIIYKLFRAQLVILFNAVIWVFVLRRSGSVLVAPLRFLGTWMLFTNLSLHRLGAALVMKNAQALWVIRSEVDFVDEAVLASAERARRLVAWRRRWARPRSGMRM